MYGGNQQSYPPMGNQSYPPIGTQSYPPSSQGIYGGASLRYPPAQVTQLIAAAFC